jgi:hypothetical protein
MNPETVVVFHTIIFFALSMVPRKAAIPKKVPKRTSGAAYRQSGDLKGKFAF